MEIRPMSLVAHLEAREAEMRRELDAARARVAELEAVAEAAKVLTSAMGRRAESLPEACALVELLAALDAVPATEEEM